MDEEDFGLDDILRGAVVAISIGLAAVVLTAAAVLWGLRRR